MRGQGGERWEWSSPEGVSGVTQVQQTLEHTNLNMVHTIDLCVPMSRCICCTPLMSPNRTKQYKVSADASDLNGLYISSDKP